MPLELQKYTKDRFPFHRLHQFVSDNTEALEYSKAFDMSNAYLDTVEPVSLVTSEEPATYPQAHPSD